MKKVVLILVRNCYPYEEKTLSCFEKVEGFCVYKNCIVPLDIISKEERESLEEKAKNKGKDFEMLIQKRSIGKLYRDDNAPWTNNNIFKDYKRNGIPVLKKIKGDLIFYVLPCTGTYYLSKDDAERTLLRQKYASLCIDLICDAEKLQRKDIYAIIHALDTGVIRGDMESGHVKTGELEDIAPLGDIANAGHLYQFHHIAGHCMYDNIVSKVCADENCNIDTIAIDDYFPKDTIGWWTKLAELNNKEY